MLDVRLWTVATMLPACIQIAASQSFIEGKNLFQIQESLCDKSSPSGQTAFVPRSIVQPVFVLQAEPLPPVILPRWLAEKLPFFCRIEHKMAKNNAIPLKFRLGSVEYVDWLEGKNTFFPCISN